MLGRALLEESEGIGLDKGVDVLGSIAVTAALMLGIYAIVSTPDHGWGSAHTLLFGGAGVALLLVFFALQARLANPIMPLRILRVPGLASTSIVRGLLASGLFSTFFLGALYLERVRGDSALRTGVAFLPLSLAVGVLSAGITARLMSRFGARRVMLPGLPLTAAGLLLMSAPRRALQLFPGDVPRPADPRARRGPRVHPAARDRDGERAERRCRAGLGHRQRVAADVRRDRPGGAGHDLDRSRTLARAEGHALPDALTSGYQLAFLVGAACVALGAAWRSRCSDAAAAGAGLPSTGPPCALAES